MYNMRRKGAESRRERFLRFYELYCDGLTYQQIADKEGITRERVRQVLHKGATTEEFKELKRLIDVRRDNSWRTKEVENLLATGSSCPQIAKLLNISVDAVKRISAKRTKRLKVERSTC
jgi:DNA-binding CsgD family transcriptional regulator